MAEPKDSKPNDQPKAPDAAPAPAPPATPEPVKQPEPTTVVNKRTGTITATVA